MILTAEEILEILGNHAYTIEEATGILNNAGRDIAYTQLIKIAKWIRERPTDGWDKWHFYNKDLAETLLKECER